MSKALEVFIANFYIKGLTEEEAKEQELTGTDYDVEYNKRLQAIGKKVQTAFGFFKDNGIQLDDETIKDTFYAKKVSVREQFDFKKDLTVKVEKEVACGVMETGFTFGYAKVDSSDCQLGLVADKEFIYAFNRFNGNGGILEAYKMPF